MVRAFGLGCCAALCDCRTLSDVARNAGPLEHVGCGGIRCRTRLRSTPWSFVIWATFPIASALVVGMALHKATKIPLIVDLRDPIDLRRLARESMEAGNLQ